MRKTTMLLAVLGLGLVSLFAAASTAPAQSDTSGKVTLETKSIAIGVGVSWGGCVALPVMVTSHASSRR